MNYTSKFIDTNILLSSWTDPQAKAFVQELDPERHCTSVLVLTETYHKLQKFNVKNLFLMIRAFMASMKVYEVTQNDFFEAAKNKIEMPINDKIHIAVMKRNNVKTIVSYDKDFDLDKTILREEP